LLKYVLLSKGRGQLKSFGKKKKSHIAEHNGKTRKRGKEIADNNKKEEKYGYHWSHLTLGFFFLFPSSFAFATVFYINLLLFIYVYKYEITVLIFLFLAFFSILLFHSLCLVLYTALFFFNSSNIIFINERGKTQISEFQPLSKIY